MHLWRDTINLQKWTCYLCKYIFSDNFFYVFLDFQLYIIFLTVPCCAPILYHKVLYHTTLLCLSYKSLHHLISQEFLQLKAKSGHMAGHRTYYQEFNDGSYILYTQIAEFRVLEEPCKKKCVNSKCKTKIFFSILWRIFGKLFKRTFRTTLRIIKAQKNMKNYQQHTILG